LYYVLLDPEKTGPGTCPCSRLATLLEVTTCLAESWLGAATLGSGIFAWISFLNDSSRYQITPNYHNYQYLFCVYYQKSACVQVF
jgi:hypothetical protein